ncbi:PP0621 family protein [Cupriavidus necator]|uniref:PP0621 family protein n=1 Tax=Cupriavidus necator TaxID=106590 RepID=UPI00339DA658
MVRILILLAVVLGVIWWLRARAEARLAEMRAKQEAREASERAAASAANAGKAGQPGAAPAEPMVQCAQCGVHLPQGEAIAWRGLHYCRRSHLPDEAGTGTGTGTGTDGPGA